MNFFQDLARWFWHLLPANPILVRVVSTGGKRHRHALARLIYLTALFLTLLAVSTVSTSAISLADQAKAATRAFVNVSMLQLFLMCFIAPVFCAGAITQEKDSNTFNILLTTPLTNGQIVLGSLFSRLYFVWVLLLAGLPIFCITMIYGGVTRAEIFESFGLAACTALVTGALAITISFLKVGTRRTIFAFFVGIAIYLLGVGALGLMMKTTWVAEAPVATGETLGLGQRQMSGLAALHPFLALFVVVGKTPAPSPSDVYQYGWPWRWVLAYPQYAYMTWTTLASMLMVTLAVLFVRRGGREGEASLLRRVRGVFARGEAELTRRPRSVGRNPIAWREAKTRASAGGRSIIRWVFAAVGLGAALLLLAAHFQDWWGLGNLQNMRSTLVVVIWIEFAVILLVTTNTAATAMTREKESQTMELLLCTPLTSLNIIWGMWRGLVQFVLPLIVVPMITIALFVLAGLIGKREPAAAVESIVLAPLLIVSFVGLASIIGLNFSLKSRKTVQAVMSATGVVLGIALVLSGCVMAMLRGGGSSAPTLAAMFSPFTPFPGLAALINPTDTYDPFGMGNAAQVMEARVIAAIASLLAAALWSGIALGLYKSMERGFDMTMRRQAI